MSSETDLFDEQVATEYEAWYQTPSGSEADVLEKTALERLLQGFSTAETVLEVGAGTGHFTRWLRSQGFNAVGLDKSNAMLAEARKADGLLLVQANAHRLPFRDQAFDLVAFVTTLEFLNRDQHAIAEALRVARRGLILGVLNRWSALGVQRRIRGWFYPTIYNTAHFYTVFELKRLLQSTLDSTWITEGEAQIRWYTTLFPSWWPCKGNHEPWGGFIAMALSKSELKSPKVKQNEKLHEGG